MMHPAVPVSLSASLCVPVGAPSGNLSPICENNLYKQSYQMDLACTTILVPKSAAQPLASSLKVSGQQAPHQARKKIGQRVRKTPPPEGGNKKLWGTGAGPCFTSETKILPQSGTRRGHGDSEANPGPADEDFQLDPPIFHRVVHALGCPRPYVDAFAAPHNNLCARFWTVADDALKKSWGSGLLPIWANPPFTLMPKVLDKIEREECFLILICPEWRLFFRRARALASRAVRLPPGPLFRRRGADLLPEPLWPVWALLIDTRRSTPGRGADLLSCGDVEANRAEMAGCELFTTLDLRDAFHQVGLHEESRWVTCIQLPGGLWQWRVVPQGINVGPALLQRDIDSTCKAVDDVARPYFDDIIIGTKRDVGMTDQQLVEKHTADVVRTLDRLEADRWVADRAKARLLMSRVEFCGHVLGGGKRVPAPGKLAAVQHWTPPPTITALRAFLGLCNYYASYVRMFAELAAPLQDKLKVPKELGKAGSKHKITWTAEELIAFERLKQALVADLELHHIDSRKPFVLRTDASQYAIGAALEQFPNHSDVPELEEMIKPGCSVPVGFLSRKLTPGQRDRWDTRDKETYAVVSGLERWAGQMGYNKVLVLTDHKTLESWHKEHVAGMGPTGRRARWHSKLNKFRIEVIHIPGAANIPADALSRWEYPASSGYDDSSWNGTPDDTEEMEQALREERELKRRTPKVQNPLETEAAMAATTPDGVAPQPCTVSTVTATGGVPMTMISAPDGWQRSLAWFSFKPSVDMDRVIAAVTRSKRQHRQPPKQDHQDHQPPHLQRQQPQSRDTSQAPVQSSTAEHPVQTRATAHPQLTSSPSLHPQRREDDPQHADEQAETSSSAVTSPKRGRGRPRKGVADHTPDTGPAQASQASDPSPDAARQSSTTGPAQASRASDPDAPGRSPRVQAQ